MPVTATSVKDEASHLEAGVLSHGFALPVV